MTRSKIKVLSLIFVLILLVSCAKKTVEPQGISGTVLDKIETMEDHYYILLDTNQWIQIDENEYIGLDIGDFYEED